MLVRGKPVRINSPADAIANGIAYLPEDRCRHGVVMGMQVCENVSLAALRTLSRFGAIDMRRERALASEYTQRLGNVQERMRFTRTISFRAGPTRCG